MRSIFFKKLSPKYLKVKHKIFLMPFLATCAFLLILFVTEIFDKKNERLLYQFEIGYVPVAELSQELEDILATIQRTLQFAVSSADREVLVEVDSLKEFLLLNLKKAKSNPTWNTYSKT